jgi:hypothetical protein
MASLYQDIQTVRSFRGDIRERNLPVDIINSIESIHTCISSGTDLNGWKKVEWRGNNTHTTNNTNTHSKNNSNGGFFSNRGFNNSGSSFNRSRNTVPNVNNTQSSVNNTQSIPLTSVTKVETNTHHIINNNLSNKYVSRFKKESEKVDDTILNTIILGKLNKFSQINYNEVKEFITHIIDSGQTDMIKCFMQLVFQKAASEEIFCPLYAKLLSELSSGYPILLTEMANLYTEYMKIFEEVQETNEVDYNELVKRNVEKKYRRGYSQFLAELIKHEVIDTDVFSMTIDTIIKQIEMNAINTEFVKLNEEYADCLMKITKAIQSDDFDEDNDKIDTIRKSMKTDCLDRLKVLTTKNTNNKGISNKARFTLLDIYEGIESL